VAEIAASGIQFSMANQVLIEKSIKGWKEIEYEMMRDGKGNVIAVCNMENIDPVGVHTGDSIVVAPSQTLSDKEYQMLRKASVDIVTKLNIKGGCNVQLALDPNSFNYFIIEVNPRVSRSSSLASKATGYPIAKVATKIALGYGLDEIDNEITGKTKACFEPTLDYCVVKIPKWPFDKFKTANHTLGTTMMATGEVMAIGNSFESALLKAVRSLEEGYNGLLYDKAKKMQLQELLASMTTGDHNRIFFVAELIRREVNILKINSMTGIDLFFLEKIQQIVAMEKLIKDRLLEFINIKDIKLLKKKGFSDQTMAALMLNTNAKKIFEYRIKHGILPTYKMVDTCGGEFDAMSPYYYSTYDTIDEVAVSDKKKVIVIGSGPIRIGQGVEFDYCSVHCVLALKEEGYEAIIVNNNPETVSTDFDISDKLYFEPITTEDVMHIVQKEKPIGVILQFGGQTAIKLAEDLDALNVPILGVTHKQINDSEDREIFNQLMQANQILQPAGKGVKTIEEGIKTAKAIGYPVLVRPSYVIGGFGMEIVYDDMTLENYLKAAFSLDKKNPVLIDQYILGQEVEVDAISDGEDILIPGIMEHLERAGVHSGDSISVYPAYSLKADIKESLTESTKKIAKALGIKGLFNIQFIVSKDSIYVIEVNPRSSRTVPFISKVTGIPMIKIATKVLLGQSLDSIGCGTGLAQEKTLCAVKHPVFSMEKIKNAEIALGPEMKSTGEILAIEENLSKALLKGFIATTGAMPEQGKAIVSLSDQHKEDGKAYIKSMVTLGYEVYMTPGTYAACIEDGLSADSINCVDHQSLLALMKTGDFKLVVNVPSKGNNHATQGFKLRRLATEKKVTCFTSFDTFKAFVETMNSHFTIDDLNIYNLCNLE
ncbi:MAG: carbamoyl-phosphate synthase large subunit, partial [Clostridia bacterium]|nr:carbamoyl-phosphate synthase large subunit [Clostridia bacterium]